jgi:hypothetical protein
MDKIKIFHISNETRTRTRAHIAIVHYYDDWTPVYFAAVKIKNDVPKVLGILARKDLIDAVAEFDKLQKERKERERVKEEKEKARSKKLTKLLDRVNKEKKKYRIVQRSRGSAEKILLYDNRPTEHHGSVDEMKKIVQKKISSIIEERDHE